MLALTAAIAGLALDAAAELSLMDLAKRGDPEAQYLVGVAYLEGKRVPRDPATGIRWLRHATSQQHTEARFALAAAYRDGNGVPQNHAGAARLFRDGAIARHPPSQLELAKLYAQGRGVAQDDAQAIELINLAAWQNLPAAQALLGEWFYLGRGVEKNIDKSYVLLSLSGDAITPDGRKMLEEIDEKLNDGERAVLHRAVRDYRVNRPHLIERLSPLRKFPIVAREESDGESLLESDQPEALSAEDLSKLERAESLVEAGLGESDHQERVEVLRLADAVLLVDNGNPRALLVKARVRIAAGQPRQAIEGLRDAVARRPNWAEAHFWLGSSLEQIGELGEARDALTRALQIDPVRTTARQALARVHFAMGDLGAAEIQARLYLAEDPSSVAMRDVLFDSLIGTDRKEDALRMLQALRDEERDASVRTAMGRIYLDLGQTRAARAELSRAHAAEPHQPDTLRGLLELDIAEDRLSASVARIGAALKLRPEDPALHRLAGWAAAHGRRLAEAERSFQTALGFDRADVESTLRLGDLYTKQGRGDDAIAIYERALIAVPDAAEVHYRLGRMHQSRGEVARATERFEAAIRYDPANGRSKRDLATLLAEDPQRIARAFALALEARVLLPNDPALALLLGTVHLEREEYLEAIRYLERAEVHLEGDERRQVQYLLGRSYVANGQTALGRETLERALAGVGARQAPPAWAERARETLARLETVR